MGASQSTSLPSSPTAAPAAEATKGPSKASVWEATVREEEVIQAASMPLEDVPSCMNLFDTYLMCYALGPQLRYAYRYGTVNICKSKLEDFKFCMSMKGVSKDEYRELWIRRRAERAASERLDRSSEDVWEMRKDPLVDPLWADPAFPKEPNSA